MLYPNQRANMQARVGGRSHWDPDRQVDVPFGNQEYGAIRAKIAAEMSVPGANGYAVCKRYKMSWVRLKQICKEYGVPLTRKRGSGGHPKTAERIALEAAVVADARAGMYLKNLQQKYVGHAVWYICKRAGVAIRKMPESVPGVLGEAAAMETPPPLPAQQVAPWTAL